MNKASIIDVRIEIPAFSSGVKYEVDKKTDQVKVDRFLKVAMQYPCNYGYVPKTLAGDGDELDVLVVTPFPLQVGVYIDCRPIGTLEMVDEKGEDTKIIAVPGDKLTAQYHAIQSVEDLKAVDPNFLERLRHFFTHYKDLDAGKWVKLQPGWGTVEAARAALDSAFKAYIENK